MGQFHIMTIGPSCSLPSPFSVPPPIIGGICIIIGSGIGMGIMFSGIGMGIMFSGIGMGIMPSGMGITGRNRGAQRLVRSLRVKHLQKIRKLTKTYETDFLCVK